MLVQRHSNEGTPRPEPVYITFSDEEDEPQHSEINVSAENIPRNNWNSEYQELLEIFAGDSRKQRRKVLTHAFKKEFVIEEVKRATTRVSFRWSWPSWRRIFCKTRKPTGKSFCQSFSFPMRRKRSSLSVLEAIWEGKSLSSNKQTLCSKYAVFGVVCLFFFKWFAGARCESFLV